MDGLVLDSESGYFSAWQQAANAMGYALSQDLCASLSGSHGAAIRQRLLAQFGDDFDVGLFHRLSNDCWREQVQLQGIPVKTGFHALLNLLQSLNLPYCLATNSRRKDAEQCLEWAGLAGIFSILISRDDVSNPKPAADVFLKAADALNISPTACLVLEDSPIGVAAAHSASCPCFFVPSILPADSHAVQQSERVMPDLLAVADFISAVFDHPL